jgi:hypothetical protein
MAGIILKKKLVQSKISPSKGKDAQRSYPSTDDGHGWDQGDPPSVIRNGWYRYLEHPILENPSVRMGFVPDPPLIRTDRCRWSGPPIRHNLLWTCHNSRKKDRMNTDRTFLPHRKGAISATFTSDWYLRKGKSRDKMGEWLKKSTVRSQDQRRMLQANTHSFPSNCWRHKITKAKESKKFDLCKALWIAEGRFTTEDDLPIQTLGHIQNTCETHTEIHTLAHHRCWRIIHTELVHLLCALHPLNGDSSASADKFLRTIWTELAHVFPEVLISAQHNPSRM